MAIHYAPRIGRRKKSTRDLIIAILSEEYPLSLQKITNSIRKSGISITYQGVRKTVLELTKENVLTQDNKKYSLNKKWILQARAFIDKTQKNYLKKWKPLQKTVAGGNITVYTVNNLLEVEQLWGDILIEWTKEIKKKGKLNTFQVPHLWFVLGNLYWEEAQLAELMAKKTDSRALIYGNTFLDKITLKFYKDVGIKTKLVSKSNYPRNCEIGTYGDIVIQCYWPEKIAKAIDNYFAKVKRMEDMNLEKLLAIAKTKADFQITVMRNPQLAKQIQQGFLKEFRSN